MAGTDFPTAGQEDDWAANHLDYGGQYDGFYTKEDGTIVPFYFKTQGDYLANVDENVALQLGAYRKGIV